MKKYIEIFFILILIFISSCKKEKIDPKPEKNKSFELLKTGEKQSYTIVQYNVENLFDTKDDAGVYDTEFTPNGKKHWTYDKYKDKLSRLARVISAIPGKNKPAIIGLNEIENRAVIEDLIKTGDLQKINYGIAHLVDNDPRGIENAFVYDKHRFKLINYILTNKSDHNYRKPLAATFLCNNGDTITFISVHFPSRLGGVSATEYKRLKVANSLDNYINKHQLCNQKCILLGDFNDNPTDKSVKILTLEKGKTCFTNPSEKLWTNYYGTLYYGTMQWYDHLMYSNGLKTNTKLHYVNGSEKVFNPTWISYGNKPFRSFNGDNYANGYSDHYPVYCTLEN